MKRKRAIHSYLPFAAFNALIEAKNGASSMKNEAKIVALEAAVSGLDGLNAKRMRLVNKLVNNKTAFCSDSSEDEMTK